MLVAAYLMTMIFVRLISRLLYNGSKAVPKLFYSAIVFSVFLFSVSPDISAVTGSKLSNVANIELRGQIAETTFPDDVSGKAARFTYLKQLFEISSGAKQVLASDRTEAHNAYIKARKLYLAALQETDEIKVKGLLDQTVKVMYQAIRLASPKELTDRKKERDYKRRLLSINALIEALERIAIEKKNVEETDKLKTNVLSIIESADRLFMSRSLDEARQELDEAYLLVKTGIENMRSGDVLVRELHFNSVEEEYAYELDRNDTHQMLIKLLVKKKLESKPLSYKQQIDKLVIAAEKIREQAEALGNRGKHQAAIEELEKSTRELIRAIRMGGIYIPG